jgi:hypothetical protein
VHLLNGDALEFTTAYLTARLGKSTEPADTPKKDAEPNTTQAEPRPADGKPRPTPVRPPAPRDNSERATPSTTRPS